MAWREPMIVLGDVNRLHVRVDIDENDLPMFVRGAEAVATLKGKPQVRVPPPVRQGRAVRHPQEEPDGREHRARRYPRPASHLRAPRRAAGARLRRPADGCLPEGGHPPRGTHARGRPRRPIAVRGRDIRSPRAEGGSRSAPPHEATSHPHTAQRAPASSVEGEGGAGGAATTWKSNACVTGGPPPILSCRMISSSYWPGFRPFREIVFLR